MPIIGTIASSIRVATNSYESISTAVVQAGGSQAVTISSIPQGYTHLQVRGSVRSHSGTTGNNNTFSLRFNGDSGGNYWRQRIYATDNAGVGADFTGTTGIDIGNYTFTPTSMYSGVTIDIVDYANTNKMKFAKAISGHVRDSSFGRLFIYGGYWNNTNAITSITFFSVADSFGAGTQFALYGIKG